MLQGITRENTLVPPGLIGKVVMKQFWSATIAVLLLGMLVACSSSTPIPPTATPSVAPPTPTSEPAPVDSGGVLRPGDRVKGMLLTVGGTTDFPFVTDFDSYCEREGTRVACRWEAGKDIGISFGLHADTFDDLEFMWETWQYDLYLDGQPVDLSAFGSVEVDDPEGTWKIRAFSVVLTDTSPGTITAHHVGAVFGETFDETMDIILEP
jgi:hypothetical protein